MISPYENLPPRAYWRSGVGQRKSIQTSDLYIPRFKIGTKQRIVTAGSCFAQHVGRTLKTSGFNVLDAEPGPRVRTEILNEFGFGLYSGRYGNIYTARQMLQLLQEAFEGRRPDAPVWEKNGKFYDAQRPSVEPHGLETREQVLQHREKHLDALRELFSNLDVFVFTFGLTEAWVSKVDGTVYPTAPGTIAGTFDAEKFEFVNFRYNDILTDFRRVRTLIRERNPKAKFIVTVSPVPLTATASGNHVEVASSYSKSVLRAVCGALYEDHKYIDYFPSYEVITSQTAHGTNYESNYRSVRGEGVDKAMALFMKAHKNTRKKSELGSLEDSVSKTDDIVCEEALLEAFSK